MDALGAANTYLAVWLAHTPVKVPDVVTGELLIVNSVGNDNPTDVTVPNGLLDH